ncbi:MAG: 2-phospho-L-lactate guanylyltransferase [Legionellaceae bacterium]|nr:2-phospho-L-lactate guanylyltransferase [Legionellaceae bacterium]
MSLWIVLPVKPFSEGKSRLATRLTPQQRYDLNKYLFTFVLDIAQKFLPQRVLVISRCQSVLLMAKQFAAQTLTEKAPFGLNTALTQANQWLKNKSATHLLIIPTDLPNLTMHDLTSLIPSQSGHVLIARDRVKQGTNALYHPVAPNLRYQFGEGSCSRHVIEAHKAGLQVTFNDNPILAFDLDTPADYAEWTAEGRSL